MCQDSSIMSKRNLNLEMPPKESMRSVYLMAHRWSGLEMDRNKTIEKVVLPGQDDKLVPNLLYTWFMVSVQW